MIKVSQIHAALRWHLWDPYQESETRLLNLGLPPYFSTIFAGLAMDGLGFAPMGFWLSMLISMLVIKLLMGYLGFKLGTSVIETLSDKIGKISSAKQILSE